jgi:hypothetical protein
MNDDRPELGELDQGLAVISIFVGKGCDEGFLGLVLRGAPLILIGEEPFPAIRMSPDQARHVGSELFRMADLIEEKLNLPR